MTWIRDTLLLVSLLALAGCRAPGSPAPIQGDQAHRAHRNRPGERIEPISDRTIRADIGKKMQALYDTGDYPAFGEILPQLDRRRCRLARVATDESRPGRAWPTWKVYEESLDQVLIVCRWYQCDRCDKWHQSQAGGFAVTADGAVVTSYHVVDEEDAEFMVAVTRSGRVYPVREILAADRAQDVAILQVETGGDRLIPVTLRASAPVGSHAIVISHPDSRFYTLTHGLVSRYFQPRRSRRPTTWMAITADFARGSSGSPVFDEYGRVIGVVSRTDSIVYDTTEHGEANNLQMVLKICSPAQTILDLIEEPQ